MAYARSSRLIARRGYSGSPDGMAGALGSLLDDLKSAGSKVLNFYGQAQKDAGAVALAQQQAAAQAAMQAQQYQMQQGGMGLSTNTLLIGGAAVLGLVLLLRK